MHVALTVDRLDGVEALGLVEHAEREHGKHLGLTALEEAGAMYERQVGTLDHDRANLVGRTPVHALTGLDDHGAHGLLLERLEVHRDLALPQELLLLGELCLDGILQSLDLGDTALLVGIGQSGVHLVVMGEDALLHLGHRLVERVLLRHDGTVYALPLLNELELGVTERTDGLLAELHGGEHVVLGDLLGAGLHHGDEVAGTGKLEVEVGVLALLIGGVHDELARLLIAADAHAGERALEGHATKGERKRSAHGADDIDGVHLVGHERGGNDLHLVAEAVREARADGTVDHARGEGGLLGGTALALEVAARDTAGSVELLIEVDGEREEIVVLALLGDHNGHERGRVTLLDEGGAGSLLGKLTGFERIGLAIQLEGLADESHLSPSSPHAPLRTGFFGPALRQRCRAEISAPT